VCQSVVLIAAIVSGACHVCEGSWCVVYTMYSTVLVVETTAALWKVCIALESGIK
jgi:hypothetical protein